jgi:hypothetical protein
MGRLRAAATDNHASSVTMAWVLQNSRRAGATIDTKAIHKGGMGMPLGEGP